MSGPRLSREKRFKIFRTDYDVDAAGSYTIHARTNITASPDSTFHVKAPSTDFNDNPVTGVKGGNVFHWRKDTVNYSSFTATSPVTRSSQDIPLFLASPGMMVVDVVANLTTLFWGSTASKIEMMIGDATDRDGFAKLHSVGSTETTGWFLEAYGDDGTTGILNSDKGRYLQTASSMRRKFYTSATMVTARFNATNHFLASMTQGAVDIYTFYAQCE